MIVILYENGVMIDAMYFSNRMDAMAMLVATKGLGMDTKLCSLQGATKEILITAMQHID